MKLPSQDSATGRGIKTGIQTVIGVVIAFAVGLVGAINAVPGCSDAVLKFVGDNIVQLASVLGISSGLVAFVWNAIFRKDVKNY